MSSIITDKFKKSIMDNIVVDINSSNSNYFMIASKHTVWDNELVPDAETTSLKDSSLDIKRELMFGKLIANVDITFMIDKNQWAANTVYAKFDHRDADLLTNTYFVVNSSNAIYKVINNNKDGFSTVEPTSTPNTIFTLADGYQWKYMYKISSANAAKFSDTSFVAFDVDANVASSAANGAIHVISVDDGGNNWITTLEGFIQQVVDTVTFKVSGDGIVATNGFYTNSAIHIANGTATGNVSVLVDYFSNSSGNFIVTTDTLSLDLTSGFNIAPFVSIIGDGTGAKAHSLVVNNVIDSIVMVNEGQDYSFANVVAIANSSHGVGETLTAIISPVGGHGSDVATELTSNHLGISVEFANNETNTIPTEIEFRQVGILNNPIASGNSEIWSNTTFNQTLSFDIATGGGTLILNEQVDGLSSGAIASVAFANTTFVITTLLSGVFADGESILGQESGVSGTISNINTPDLENQTGEVFYYDNITPTQRSDTTSEVVKLIIQF